MWLSLWLNFWNIFWLNFWWVFGSTFGSVFCLCYDSVFGSVFDWAYGSFCNSVWFISSNNSKPTFDICNLLFLKAFIDFFAQYNELLKNDFASLWKLTILFIYIFWNVHFEKVKSSRDFVYNANFIGLQKW